jgi:hypothetical protein
MSSSTQPRTFTVIISRDGFNGTSGTFDITLRQGDSAKITFVYGDNDLSYDNPHAIAIDGYRIRTVDIGKSNPTVTVEFVADVSGTFKIYCYTPCVGMGNLQDGRLIVTEGQASRTTTILKLAFSNVVAKSNSFTISASIQDANGKPVAGAPVKFYENTTFGKLLLKTVATNSLGVVTIDYSTSRPSVVQIIAEYSGDASYGRSSNVALITAASQATGTENADTLHPGAREPNQMPDRFYGILYPPNLSMIGVPEATNILTVILAGVVVLGVWFTYAYIGREIASLRKHGTPHQRKMRATLSSSEMLLDVDGIAPPEISKLANKTLALLLLTPLLGVADVLLVNSLELSIMWTAISLVGLAVLETLGIVAIVKSDSATD